MGGVLVVRHHFFVKSHLCTKPYPKPLAHRALQKQNQNNVAPVPGSETFLQPTCIYKIIPDWVQGVVLAVDPSTLPAKKGIRAIVLLQPSQAPQLGSGFLPMLIARVRFLCYASACLDSVKIWLGQLEGPCPKFRRQPEQSNEEFSWGSLHRKIGTTITLPSLADQM